jgi:acetolactate synthase-1/2/3 large subunit
MYGTIRAHQERNYPGRVVGTALTNPDFVAYARAFGGFGVAVERTEDFPAAFKAARESGLPAILHLKVDPQGISPTATIDTLRERALAAQK